MKTLSTLLALGLSLLLFTSGAPGQMKPNAGIRGAKPSKGPSLKMAWAHLIIRLKPNHIDVAEYLRLVNDGGGAHRGGLSIPLFQGAHELSQSDSKASPLAVLKNNEAHLRGPFAKGITFISFTYKIPRPKRLAFSKKTYYPISSLHLILNSRDFDVVGPTFKGSKVKVSAKMSMLSVSADNLPAGGHIHFILKERDKGSQGMAATPATPNIGGSAHQHKKKAVLRDWRIVVRWLLPMVLMILLMVVIILSVHAPERGEASLLEAERERFLRQLADLERGDKRGDYQEKRKEILKQLAQLYAYRDTGS